MFLRPYNIFIRQPPHPLGLNGNLLEPCSVKCILMYTRPLHFALLLTNKTGRVAKDKA